MEEGLGGREERREGLVGREERWEGLVGGEERREGLVGRRGEVGDVEVVILVEESELPSIRGGGRGDA